MDLLFSRQVLDFYNQLELPSKLPSGVETLYPFKDKYVMQLNEEFYNKFYGDKNERTYLIGINPGRLGAGVTGIPFTDPIRLESELGIANEFQKKAELSSKFIYDVINTLGGAHSFFSRFYFTSVSPIGFTKNGKNLNYYDQKDLERDLRSYITKQIEKQLSTLPSNRKKAFCLGNGKNYKFLKKLNEEKSYFDEIIPLPHPRWVMQYRLKTKSEFILEYQQKLEG